MSSSARQPNKEFTETIGLLDTYVAGGQEAPGHFRDFLQKLLSLTVLSDGQSLRLHYSNSPTDFTIAGPKRTDIGAAAAGREFFQPLKLNDGHFLFVIYDCFLDRSNNDCISVRSSKVAYQLDFNGHKQVFRYDHNRIPGNRYPTSHLHIYGTWLHQMKKELSKTHFPVIRFSMESIIKLLVHDFQVASNLEEAVWEPIFFHSEKKFLEIMTKGQLILNTLNE